MALPSFLQISDNLQKRIVSATILMPIVLLAVFEGSFLYFTLVVVGALIMAFEWNDIIRDASGEAMPVQELRKWQLIGVAYIAVFAVSFLYLRSLQGGGAMVVMLLAIVWATDIGAYAAGKLIGGPKLCPDISPGKTWAGLGGGALAAGFVGAFFAVFIDGISAAVVVILSVCLAILSQMGDLGESWFKRKFGVKDSGSIIPGHGGVMDRVDGLVTAAPVFVIMTLALGSFF